MDKIKQQQAISEISLGVVVVVVVVGCGVRQRRHGREKRWEKGRDM
jgi:hypothetical protein